MVVNAPTIGSGQGYDSSKVISMRSGIEENCKHIPHMIAIVKCPTNKKKKQT